MIIPPTNFREEGRRASDGYLWNNLSYIRGNYLMHHRYYYICTYIPLTKDQILLLNVGKTETLKLRGLSL